MEFMLTIMATLIALFVASCAKMLCKRWRDWKDTECIVGIVRKNVSDAGNSVCVPLSEVQIADLSNLELKHVKRLCRVAEDVYLIRGRNLNNITFWKYKLDNRGVTSFLKWLVSR